MNLFEIAINLFEGVIVYHGTDHSFEDFDLEKIGSSDGRSLGGWGIYFAEDPEVPKQYITGRGKIKKYELRQGKFFDLDDFLISGSGDMILRELERIETVSEDDIEEFRTDYVDYGDSVSNHQAYEWLSYTLDTEKNVSLFLKNLGYDGNIYKDRTNPESNNYAIYNMNLIRKIPDYNEEID